MGSRERIGDHVAVGYLTTDTVVQGARQYTIAVSDGDLHVDAELCVELASDVAPGTTGDAVPNAIARCWPALEIVDLAPLVGEPESIVVENVFHRAVAFGAQPVPLASAQQVTLSINGERRDHAPWPIDVPDRIAHAAATLAGIDEYLRAGDRIITGAIIQLPIAIGDLLQADFGDASIAVELLDEGQRVNNAGDRERDLRRP